MQQIWDISPPVSAQAPVFPGDTPYSQRWSALLAPGCPVNVSEITMSPHVGAHADAPLHYSRDGMAAGRLPLHPYIGPCRVIHRMHGGALITPEDLQPFLADVPPRVLVRTCERANTSAWSNHFTAFAADTIAILAKLGVLLIGLDTPSIDPAESKELPSHQAVLHYDVRVLENLVLDDIAAGDYELIALPLALVDADASPVRAILRPLPASSQA